MKLFEMIRHNDFSGVSGTGLVLRGVVFPDDTTIIQWSTKTQSINIYKTFEDFLSVHVDSHPTNETEITWL